MHRGLWCAAFVGAGLLVGSVAIHAVPPHGDHGHVHPAVCPLGGNGPGSCGGIAILHEALHGLNLSDAQREAMHETLKSHGSVLAKAVKPVSEAKRALCDAVLADSPDDAAIRNAATTLGTSIGDAAVVLAKIKGELVKNAKFTPEQTKKLGDFKPGTGASIDTFLTELEKRH